MVSDGDSLTPVTAAAQSTPVMNAVCVPESPIAINAGDSIGHMGFYQLPEEKGHRSRYQVHIECLSMDDMARFITNPEKVGEDTPFYLTYPVDALLFDKGLTGMVASSRKTRALGIVTLTKVPGADAEGNVLTNNKEAAYFQIHREGGWLAAESVRLVSQYALDERGFVTLDKAPESFDLIDGIKHPNNVVKGILEQLCKAAEEETRPSHALNKYNYQRLLEWTDSNPDGEYSEQDYLQALHTISYRDRLYRVIARHASEWYPGKDDPLWKSYLDTLTKDAPEWKAYTEAFIENMTWMKRVEGMGPEVWHMHPVVFLGVFEIIPDNKITIEMLLAANLGVNTQQCLKVLPYMNKYSKIYDISDNKEIAHFLSQIGHESKFRIIEEDLVYKPKRMREIYGCKRGPKNYIASTDECSLGRLRDKLWTNESYYANNAENLGNYVYEKRMGNDQESSGDGYKYRGRGMIQLTGKDAYQSFSDTHNQMNSSDIQNFVNTPDLLINNIEYGVESAFSFWVKKTNAAGMHLSEIAKSGSVLDVTQIVNGGQNGYVDRKKRYNRVAPLLGLNLED